MTEPQNPYKPGASEMEESISNARAMIGWDTPVEVTDDGDLRKYRIELPNLYDDAGLDPYEFRLLAHYKRVGNCTEGTRTTAEICKMSPGQVSQKRQSLRKKGFISMQKVPLSKFEFSYRITVIDRWQENFTKYSTPSLGTRSPHEHPRSPHETKKVVVAVDTANIYTAYENEIGMLTAFISEDINDWSKTVSEAWILAAIHEAAKQNKRNWKYCAAILKRWKEQGFMDDGKPKPAPVTPPQYQPIPERVRTPRPAHIKRPENIS